MGAVGVNGGGLSDSGAAFVLFLDLASARADPASWAAAGGAAAPVVAAAARLTSGEGGFPAAPLGALDFFGCGVAVLGDVSGEGVVDFAVGAYGDDDGGSSRFLPQESFLSLFLLCLGPSPERQRFGTNKRRPPRAHPRPPK